MTSPTASATALVIERRFNGPLESANGGYACGLVARHVDGPATVTLRRPIPLETPLELERHDDGRVTLHDGELLLAEGEPALPLDEVELPYRPSVEEATVAALAGFGLRPPEFAHCYVCAADRPDGLGVDFGALPTHPDMTGAVLRTDDPAPELVWAALDCPSYAPALWRAEQPSLLARMTCELLEPIEPGEPLAVTGWSLGADGRKHHSATALLAADGRVLARARALWIELRA